MSAIRPGRLLSILALLSLTFVAYRGFLTSSSWRTSNILPEQSSKVRWAIICMTTSETTYDHISFSNKHLYAAKWGVDLIWDFKPSRHYIKVWDKLNLTRDAIQSSIDGEKAYEWIWMLDFDTLITNSSIQISDVIEQSLVLAEREGKLRDDVHLVLTRDCEPLNLGSLFLRASPWTLDFIEQWRSGERILNDRGKLRNEQDVLQDMLYNNEFAVVNQSIIAPQWMFDAYPKEIECYDPRDPKPWEPGMFVLHFAGAKYRFPDQKDPLGAFMRRYSVQAV